MRYFFTVIGEDSHRFVDESAALRERVLKLAGCEIPGAPALDGNSDADLLLHVVTTAISGITGEPVLGPRADELCRRGVTDSQCYLDLALEDLRRMRPDVRLLHLSISIEGKRPKLVSHFPALRASLAKRLCLPVAAVAITATTGEGMTAVGRGEGLAARCLLSAEGSLDFVCGAATEAE